MGRINVGRLVMGGLAAGVVANALDFVVNTYLMEAESVDMIQRLNLSQEVVAASLTTWIVVDFIWGLVLVFAYAAMRPRFGPGPTTATIAGVTLWLAVAAVFAGLMSMGIYTMQAYIKSSVLSLGTTLITVMVGAAIYKEEQ
jgi:drug/metabolite transporter (DMT)-like permease